MHPTNFALRASRVKARQISPILWEVTVGYDSPTKQGTENPLAQPAVFRFFEVTNNEKADEDINGKPIVTPNGERYEPFDIDWQDMGMEVTRNVAYWDPFDQLHYYNTTNSDQFGPFPPGVVKLAGFTALTKRDQDFDYWEVSATFHMRIPRGEHIDVDKSWWKRIRCEGLYVRKKDTVLTGEWFVVRAVDKEKQPVSQPVLLNKETGVQLPNAVPPAIGPDAQWQEFQVYRSVPYGPLGIFF